jgi:L-fuconolactonase
MSTVAGIAVLDAHHHLWDSGALTYSLLEGPLKPVAGRYDAEMFDDLANGQGISASVVVEATSAGADGPSETSWLLTQAAASKVVRGVVAWAPLGRGDTGEYLDELLPRSEGLVVGVRRSFEFCSPDELVSPALQQDLKSAAARGLAVDLVLFESSLPQAFELAKACGEVRFVLDHLGKPLVGRGLEPWRRWIKALGSLDNVFCKISGLAVEAHDPNWRTEDLVPYLDTALECFGWDRVMFGTDWPVCDLAGGIPRWAHAIESWSASASRAEQGRLYWDNAIRFWGLDPGPGLS